MTLTALRGVNMILIITVGQALRLLLNNEHRMLLWFGVKLLSVR